MPQRCLNVPNLLTASMRQFVFLVCLVTALLASGLTAVAQEDTANRQLELWPTQLESLEKALRQPDISDTGLAEIKTSLEGIRKETLSLRGQLQPSLSRIEEQYKLLGKKPEGGKEELGEITTKRNTLEKRLETLQALITRLDVNAVRASQLSDSAAELQRQQFTKRVLTSSKSVLNPRLWLDGIIQFKTLWVRVSRAVKVWLEQFKLNLNLNTFLIIAAAAGIALFIAFSFRRLLGLFLGPNIENENPSQLEKLWLATRAPLVNCISGLLAFLAIYVALEQAGFMSLRMERLVQELTSVTILYVLVRSLTWGILAPTRPAWRLPVISDETASTLKWHIDLLALLMSIDILFKFVAASLFMPVQFAQAQIADFSIITVIIMSMLLMRLSPDEEADLQPIAASTVGDFSWASKMRNFIWLLIVFIAMSLIFGFLALGHFLSEQLVRTSTLIVLIYLLHCLVDEILTTGLKPGWVLGDFFRRNLGFSTSALSRFALFGSTIFDFILVFIGLPLIVSNWALTWVDLESWMSKLFFGFQVGNLTISLSVILLAIGAFIAGLVITRLFTKWLDNRVLARTRLNSGVKDSIKTATGYSGFILTCLFAISFTGLDFSKVAIVAGALSVGIGFGLQSVVNNFVSGLILLVERPIKVGDWIVVAGGEGIVRNIKVRSTEIETFDRATVIVPNSSLISESVQNWTHSNTIGRLKIMVGVSYDSDPRQVEEIIRQCAVDNQYILTAPKPWVHFKDFGASSLDFELRAYLRDVDMVSRAGSELRFAIFEKLKEANIEIPFPQRDIHIRDSAGLKDILVSEKGDD